MKGQAANPRGADHMRAVQVILNANHFDEAQSVAILDWARSTRSPETGDNFTDRKIIAEALVALGEKYQDGFAPPHAIQNIDDIINVVMRLVEERLQQIAPMGEYREALRSARTQISNAVQTGNLIGQSFRYEDDD